MVGRPVLWGLAVGGASGAQRVLEILLAELDARWRCRGAERPRDRLELRVPGAVGGPAAMNILVTGITGYVGSRLAPRLLARGARRAGSHARPRVRRARPARRVPLVTGDAVSGAGLEQALEGIDVAYFLIHSMEPATDGPFETRERVAAENFTAAARAAGVARIVYLGGLVPASGPASTHIASRLAVERILLEGAPDSVAFRASIVIGAQSRSFRFLVRLVERMPVLVVPAWRNHLTQPDRRARHDRAARAGGHASRGRRPGARHRRPGHRLLRRADRPHLAITCWSAGRRSASGA